MKFDQRFESKKCIDRTYIVLNIKKKKYIIFLIFTIMIALKNSDSQGNLNFTMDLLR